MATQISTVTPQKLHEAQRRKQYTALLDVRTAAEYRSGHIPGAQLIPIEELTPDAIAKRFKRPSLGHEETLYIICQAGPRAEDAAKRLRQAGYTNLALVEGGTQHWEKAGLPLQRCGRAIALERQVQIAIGSLLVMKVLLGFSVHELFFALTAFIGVGLIVAGTTRWCGMARLIARMPWNRSDNCPEQANA
jgi:rhodanese-related sulfurtransferase